MAGSKRGVADLPRVKAAVRSVRYEELRSIAAEALALASAKAVRNLLRTRLDTLLPDYLLVDR